MTTTTNLDDFSTYCKARFQQLMHSDPLYALNKPRITSLIADEWKQIKNPNYRPVQLPVTFRP